MGCKVWGWNSSKDKGFFLGSTQQPLQWLLRFLPQFKARFDVDLSPPSRAEVKNKWCCISNPLICLYDMDGGNLTFYALLMMLLIA
jgi:hypothetical protein